MMKRKIVLCLTVLMTLTFCMQKPYAKEKAKDSEDMSLFEIDRLIRKTEYDEALRQLNIYIEHNPENFDNAQIRIKKIMNARKQYSILAERLIKLIQTDPGNNKEIYEITAQLEKFERHPSDQNLQFIADLKKSAEFNYFRAQFLEIQNATAELSHKGSYVAAIEKAKDGFWLYRDDFYERWEDNPEITQPVNDILQDLNVQIAAFEEKNFLPKINDAVNDFIKAVNQDQYETANEKLKNVEASLKRYSSLRNAIITDGMALQQKFLEVQKLDSDTTDASFLPFVFRFVFGIEAIPASGILGAVNQQFHALEKNMNDAVYAALYKKYNTYNSAIDEKYASEIKKYALLDDKVLDLYSVCAREDEFSLKNPYEAYYALTDYAENLSANAVPVAKLEGQVLKIAEQHKLVLQKIKTTSLVEEKAEYVAEMFDTNAKLSELTSEYGSYELSQKEWYVAYQKLTKEFETELEKERKKEAFAGLTQKYSQMLDNAFQTSSELQKNSWFEISAYYVQSSDALILYAQNLNDCAEAYRHGFFTRIPENTLSLIEADITKAADYKDTFNANPELDFGLNYSYPAIALRLGNYVQQKIDRDLLQIDGYEQVINSNYESHVQWHEDQNVKTTINTVLENLEERKKTLAALKKLAGEQIAMAQTQLTAFELAQNEGDIRFNEAENALRRSDFETARKKLQDAVAKYDEALGAKNDEELRSRWDNKLQGLGERIARGENEIVVREVRELKTRAKDAYFNGRFDDAEKYLNQAKIRWAVTNINEDEEITNLLNFVNTAISMKTGREILPSAPQYPEMSQLMNIAYQYFDEGSRKIGDGKKEDGLKDLDLALESIQKLQYVYPLNQEAAILTLRINRLKDPKKFSEEFSQKIEVAKMMCRSKETRQEGYANLLDYYELEPSYKGLKELIYQVEIDIGIRQKPVDNSGSAKAKKLIAEANSLYNSAGPNTTTPNTKKLQQALEKVDQALALVSDNEEAMKLKDKITLKIGGNTSTVLSTEDERLYQLAIQRLQNNNVTGAGAIVDQLLKKPQNKNSQKIKDLKNKIDARS